jgi:hypothetical protein
MSQEPKHMDDLIQPAAEELRTAGDNLVRWTAKSSEPGSSRR